MGMVTEEEQTLISDFYGHTQKKNELEGTFADDLQVPFWKIITQKSAFRAEVNESLKHQYASKLHAPYYVAIAYSMLQSSADTEKFTQFCCNLAMMFGDCSMPG